MRVPFLADVDAEAIELSSSSVSTVQLQNPKVKIAGGEELAFQPF
jgi:hypothetical protein